MWLNDGEGCENIFQQSWIKGGNPLVNLSRTSMNYWEIGGDQNFGQISKMIKDLRKKLNHLLQKVQSEEVLNMVATVEKELDDLLVWQVNCEGNH